MNKKFNAYITKFLPFIILLLLLLHLLKIDAVRIDNTTILLIVLLFVAPLIPFLKIIRWRGLEAEISRGEVRQAEESVKKLAKPEDVRTYRIIDYVTRDIYSVFESDYILGLAKLRMEIEKLLRKIIEAKKIKIDKTFGANYLIRIIKENGLIDMLYIEPLRKVIQLSNRAVHGEDIEKDDALSIIDMGLDLLKILYFEYVGVIIEPVEEKEITTKQWDEYSKAEYEVITIIPYVEKPVIKKYVVNQEQLNILLEGYHEYAEFLVSIKKLNKKHKRQ